jgi:hypothetical protein
MSMHLFVSDLHLTDGTIGAAVSDAALAELINGISRPSTGHVDLVLLGDVFELLRSSAWTDLWNQGGYNVAPWTAMNAGFQGFSPKAAACALSVLRGIIARYPAFRDAIRGRRTPLRAALARHRGTPR